MRLRFNPFLIVALAAATIMLSECGAPPPDLAPASVGSFQQEVYRPALNHRAQSINHGRALHVHKQKLVV